MLWGEQVRQAYSYNAHLLVNEIHNYHVQMVLGPYITQRRGKRAMGNGKEAGSVIKKNEILSFQQHGWILYCNTIVMLIVIH